MIKITIKSKKNWNGEDKLPIHCDVKGYSYNEQEWTTLLFGVIDMARNSMKMPDKEISRIFKEIMKSNGENLFEIGKIIEKGKGNRKEIDNE